MATVFKNIDGATRDCSGNVCTGQVTVGFQCIIIMESLNPTVTYSVPVNLPKMSNGVLRDHHCWRTIGI